MGRIPAALLAGVSAGGLLAGLAPAANANLLLILSGARSIEDVYLEPFCRR
jgi:hypothetical protein